MSNKKWEGHTNWLLVNKLKHRKWLILGLVKKTSFAKTVIFKLLLDSSRKTVILQGHRWPLNVICKEWELNAYHLLARSVTCEAVICEVLLYTVYMPKPKWNFLMNFIVHDDDSLQQIISEKHIIYYDVEIWLLSLRAESHFSFCVKADRELSKINL